MSHTVTIPDKYVPEGYEIDGFYEPANRQPFIGVNGEMNLADGDFSPGYARIVLRKKPPVYREPTADDCGAMVEFKAARRWKAFELLHVLPEGMECRFIARTKANSWLPFEEARIEA